VSSLGASAPGPPRDGASAGEPVLRAGGIAKRYGEREALRPLTLELRAGELTALIGPNGAGKTTLLSILAGVIRPSAGTVSLPPRQVGWVPQQTALYSRLTVTENLRLFARLERADDPRAVVARMLEQADLTGRADEELSRLSGGNRQRVNIAIGLLADPPVLLLDEPSAALDPRQRERLWRFVESLVDAGTSVVFSTHEVAEAERYAARVLVLADGEMLFDGPVAGLAAQTTGGGGHRDLEATFVAFLQERGH
jgi:ABC-2 type transport system ATP-binding protein